MKSKWGLSTIITITAIVFAFALVLVQPGGKIFVAHGGSTATTTVTITNSAPIVSAVNINGTNPAVISLNTNSTTTVNVEATVSDNNGCGDLNSGTTTILLYRSGYSSSSCSTNGGADASNCYLASAFVSTSSCVGLGTSYNTTTTFAVQYYARATDSSSSFASNNWMATVIFRDPSNGTGTADSSNASTTNDFQSTLSINVTTSSIDFGSVGPGVSSATSTTVVVNVGNSSTTLKLSASTVLTGTGGTIAADYEHYATSSFTWSSGGSDVHLSTTSVAVSGFTLTAPTSGTAIQGNVFWALQPPLGTATGSYAGVNQFTASFTP